MRLSRQVELMTSIRSAATADHEESQHTVSAAHERVVQMHSGSVRGADWGKHFALVRKEVLLRLAKQNRAAELRGARLKEERRVGAVAISINTHPPCKIRHTHTVCALQAGASIHRGLLLRSYGG